MKNECGSGSTALLSTPPTPPPSPSNPPEMFSLSDEPRHLLCGQVDKLDAEEGGVDEEVAALVVYQVVVLDGSHPRQLLLHRHLLAKLHGRQHLLNLYTIFRYWYSIHNISVWTVINKMSKKEYT